MDIGLILSFIIVIGMTCFALYLHYNKQMSPINFYPNNFQENFYQEEVYDPNHIDWSITQHIGWLYKNGTNNDFNNLNLYFNQSDASFFALPLDSNEVIHLNVDMVKRGDNISINNENYVVVFPEEE